MLIKLRQCANVKSRLSYPKSKQCSHSLTRTWQDFISSLHARINFSREENLQVLYRHKWKSHPLERSAAAFKGTNVPACFRFLNLAHLFNRNCMRSSCD